MANDTESTQAIMRCNLLTEALNGLKQNIQKLTVEERAKKEMEEAYARAGTVKATEQKTKTINSATPDVIDKLHEIQAKLGAYPLSDLDRDFRYLMMLAHQLIFERTQIEEELKVWRKRVDDLLMGFATQHMRKATFRG